MNSPISDAEKRKIYDESWRLYPHSLAYVASGGTWEPYPYLKLISKEIAIAIAQGGGRIIVEIPPRHGKSTLISKWTPIWAFEMFAKIRIILATYGDQYARSWGEKIRDEMLSNPILKAKPSANRVSASDFDTIGGGTLFTTGVGGALTGRGGDLIIVDDPIKSLEEAMSEVYREKTWDWFQAVLSTRCEPGATIIILMTRWHEDDIIGRLRASKDNSWKIISFPAIAEKEDILGRAVGDALCPERYPIDQLKLIKSRLPGKYWNSLYQQRPTAMEGNMFKVANWRHWDRRILPVKFDEELISMDTNVEEGKDNDYTRIQHWGKLGPNYYLLQQVGGVWGMSDQMTSFKLFCQQRPRAFRKLIEKKANGPAIQNLLKKTVSGIVMVEPMGSKYERAMAVEPLQVAGNIFIPEDENVFPWVEGFVEECSQFPKGKHDDQVDTMTQAINFWTGYSTNWIDRINTE